MDSGAKFSKDRKHRYQLWRIWDDTLPKVLFIMLNPSQADEHKNDPTITRCIGFAKDWGYGGCYIGNIFSLMSTNPYGLLEAKNPRGRNNLRHIKEMVSDSELIVCAWGNENILKKLNPNLKWLIELGLSLQCIALSKNGIPKHPLYLKKELKPIKYSLES